MVETFHTPLKAYAEKPVLLVMDNQNSYSTLEAWELAKANHVVILTIPPHSSHRLQPLDVSFLGPLKKVYNKECDRTMKSKNMIKIMPYEIAGLFNKAYSGVACIEKGISGFKATGIHPINPAVFDDDDFIDNILVAQPASPKGDIIQSAENDTEPQPVGDSSSGQTVSNNIQQQQQNSMPATDESEKLDPQPGTSSDFVSALTVLSPKPIPQISARMNTRQKQHSEILTSTPMKTVFEEKKKKRLEKEEKNKSKPAGKVAKGKATKEKGKRVTKGKNTKEKENRKTTTKANHYKQKKNTVDNEKKKRVKKNLFNSDDDESSDEEVDETQICDDESEYSDEENLCSVCLDSGKGRELWYRCRGCGKWAHAECSGVNRPVDYLCDVSFAKIHKYLFSFILL